MSQHLLYPLYAILGSPAPCVHADGPKSRFRASSAPNVLSMSPRHLNTCPTSSKPSDVACIIDVLPCTSTGSRVRFYSNQPRSVTRFGVRKLLRILTKDVSGDASVLGHFWQRNDEGIYRARDEKLRVIVKNETRVITCDAKETNTLSHYFFF